MPRHDARHVLGGHALDPRDELLEVVVGQVVERELQRGARRSARRSRSCARSRASARRCRARSSAAVTGREPRMPAISPSDSSIACAVPLVCTLTCSANGPGRAAELERGARAVGEPLVLAQVQVDPADELAAEHHVRRRRARGSRACRAPTATWPMRSSDCGARGRGTMLSRADCGSAASPAGSASPPPVQSANASAAMLHASSRDRSRRPRSASPRRAGSPARETRAHRRPSAPRATPRCRSASGRTGCAP